MRTAPSATCGAGMVRVVGGRGSAFRRVLPTDEADPRMSRFLVLVVGYASIARSVFCGPMLSLVSDRSGPRIWVILGKTWGVPSHTDACLTRPHPVQWLSRTYCDIIAVPRRVG